MFVEKNTTKMGSPIRSIPAGRGGMIFFIDARPPISQENNSGGERRIMES